MIDLQKIDLKKIAESAFQEELEKIALTKATIEAAIKNRYLRNLYKNNPYKEKLLTSSKQLIKEYPKEYSYEGGRLKKVRPGKDDFFTTRSWLLEKIQKQKELYPNPKLKNTNLKGLYPQHDLFKL